MGQNFAKRQVGRISRNKIILYCIAIALIGALLYKTAPSPGNLYLGAAAFESASEFDALYGAHEFYVTAFTDSFFDTGYYTSTDGRATHYYYTFWAGEQYVICRVGTDVEDEELYDYTVLGKLAAPTSTEAEIFTELALDLSEAWDIPYDEAQGVVSPYIVRVDQSRLFEQAGLGLAAAVAVFFALRLILAARALADYRTARAYKRLGPDAELVNGEISRDLDYGQFALDRKDLTITRGWILSRSALSFAAQRKRDLLWVYKTVTRHRTNGIPSGKTYSVTLSFADGKQFAFNARANTVDGLVAAVAADVPTALPGYSDELAALYRRDRAAFAARRDEILRSRSGGDEPL
jgi:hypothetical protein